MARREKEYMVGELVDKLKGVPYLFVTGFKGMTSLDMNDLRRELDKVSMNYMVVKNRVAKLALERSDLSRVIGLMEGPIGFTFGKEAPEVISKILINFAKDHEALRIYGAITDGEIVNADHIKTIAMLPSKEQLLATVVFGLTLPMSGLVGVLNQVVSGFVNVLDRIKEKKGEKTND